MVDTSVSVISVAREWIAEMRGCPCMVVSDNGTELTLDAILKWQEEHGVEWHCIAPGKPVQIGFVEGFEGRMPEQASICHLRHARHLIAEWRINHNHHPHSSRDGLTLGRIMNG